MTADRLSETLATLLGPAASQVACEVCFDELDRYVDLELGGQPAEAVVPGMRAHLEGCPACREEYETLRVLAAD